MSTQTSITSHLKLSNALMSLGLVSNIFAWWLIAWPVVTFSNIDKHAGHFGLVYLHAFGGTLMLFLGLANLYIGTTRQHFAYHRLIGRMYLAGGTLGALSAIYITGGSAHKAAGVSTLTNSNVSLLSLATAWLLAAAMSYRAVRNKRYGAHREWIIRSYVLVWSFVFCRLASRVPSVGNLGSGEAFIWLSWVGPLVVCEVALQWQAGANKVLQRTLGDSRY
jgi:hypothetical protein